MKNDVFYNPDRSILLIVFVITAGLFALVFAHDVQFVDIRGFLETITGGLLARAGIHSQATGAEKSPSASSARGTAGAVQD